MLLVSSCFPLFIHFDPRNFSLSFLLLRVIGKIQPCRIAIVPFFCPLKHFTFFSLGQVKFYVVFLLVNNFNGDVVVSTGLPGTSDQITMKRGDTVVVSEQPNNDDPISVTAVDTATSGEVNINGQSSVFITPAMVFGVTFQVLFIYREDPSKYFFIVIEFKLNCEIVVNFVVKINLFKFTEKRKSIMYTTV